MKLPFASETRHEFELVRDGVTVSTHDTRAEAKAKQARYQERYGVAVTIIKRPKGQPAS